MHSGADRATHEGVSQHAMRAENSQFIECTAQRFKIITFAVDLIVRECSPISARKRRTVALSRAPRRGGERLRRYVQRNALLAFVDGEAAASDILQRDITMAVSADEL